MNRVLGAIRLSVLTEETTSPERQREAIEHTVRARGDDLVHIAEDLDVSGSVSPFDRKQLGPWLTDPALISQWDALVVHSVSRASRSLPDFMKLLTWCEERGKTIVSVSESVDFGTPTGRLLGHLLALFAQFEREQVQERRRSAHVKMLSEARWGGGRVPYGYRPVKRPTGWVLEPDPVTAPLVRDIAARIIGGTSASSVCKELTARRIPVGTGVLHCSVCRKPVTGSPAAHKRDHTPLCNGAEVVPAFWRSDVLISILRSPVIAGYVVSGSPRAADGRWPLVFSEDGMPVRRDPVLTDEVWQQVQEALDRGSQQKSGQRSDASPLLHIARCGGCGTVMYVSKKKSRKHGQYVCGSKVQQTGCTEPGARADHLHVAVERALLDALGEVPMREKVQEHGENHAPEITSAEDALAHNDQRWADGEISDERHASLARILEKRRDSLAALPSCPGRTYWRDTGETFGQHWASLTEQQRRAFLISAGVTVRVYREGTWKPPARLVHFHASGDEDGLHAGRHTLLAAEGQVHAMIDMGDLARLRDAASSSLMGSPLG